MRKTAEQDRAQSAFACVQTMVNDSDDVKKKYSTQCRRLPQLIQQCGLCQTVAFLQAKSGKPTEEGRTIHRFLEDFATVVLQGERVNEPANELAARTLTYALREYQALSAHAIRCASWMKRYAEALLPAEDN